MDKTYNSAKPKRKPLKTKEVNGKGRVQYTTMIKPDLRDQLAAVAYQNRTSAADVLETVITEYFDLKLPD